MTKTQAPFKPLNSAKEDFTTDDGVRFCLPLYLDPPNNIRKEILQAFRERLNNEAHHNDTNTKSGIGVTTYTFGSAAETYVGMNLSVLRGVLFQRGGLPMDLLFRLQHVTGVEVISQADLTKFFDTRKKQAIAYMKDVPDFAK